MHIPKKCMFYILSLAVLLGANFPSLSLAQALPTYDSPPCPSTDTACLIVTAYVDNERVVLNADSTGYDYAFDLSYSVTSSIVLTRAIRGLGGTSAGDRLPLLTESLVTLLRLRSAVFVVTQTQVTYAEEIFSPTFTSGGFNLYENPDNNDPGIPPVVTEGGRLSLTGGAVAGTDLSDYYDFGDGSRRTIFQLRVPIRNAAAFMAGETLLEQGTAGTAGESSFVGYGNAVNSRVRGQLGATIRRIRRPNPIQSLAPPVDLVLSSQTVEEGETLTVTLRRGAAVTADTDIDFEIVASCEQQAPAELAGTGDVTLPDWC